MNQRARHAGTGGGVCLLCGLLLASWLGGCAHAQREPEGEPEPAARPSAEVPVASSAAQAPEPRPSPPPPPSPSLPSPPPAPAEPAPLSLVEVFPMVRVDRAAHVVEFDGIVPLDCHDPVTPLVYLELVACTPDTREHESLIMTRAKPSHIHAALLAAGFESGSPGLVDFTGPKVVGRPPSGSPLRIEFIYTSAAGETITARPEDWIVDERSGRPLGALPERPGVWGGSGGWVFAGSRFVTRRDPETGAPAEVYDSDGSGVLIGLTTFGSETIAWGQVMSPESSITAPQWVTRNSAVPPFGAKVRVRLTRE